MAGKGEKEETESIFEKQRSAAEQLSGQERAKISARSETPQCCLGQNEEMDT